ncbi:hypothetical protein E2562_035018, partial [Oryza meyeriana var. granulata]
MRCGRVQGRRGARSVFTFGAASTAVGIGCGAAGMAPGTDDPDNLSKPYLPRHGCDRVVVGAPTTWSAAAPSWHAGTRGCDVGAVGVARQGRRCVAVARPSCGLRSANDATVVTGVRRAYGHAACMADVRGLPFLGGGCSTCDCGIQAMEGQRDDLLSHWSNV